VTPRTTCGGPAAAPAAGIAAPTPLIRLENVTLRVGDRRILADTSWDICQGQQWVVMGPNGSGKTSLAGALTGEVPVVSGRRWRDQGRLPAGSVRHLSFETQLRLMARDQAGDEACGFAGQWPQGFRVCELLASGARGAGDSAHTWCERMELGELWTRRFRTLSSGERHLIMLARAIIAQPRLLIIDEPFAGLDEEACQRIGGLIAKLVRGGLQIVLITHHADELLPGMTHGMALGADGVLAQGPLATTPGPWRMAPAPSASGPGAIAGAPQRGRQAMRVAPSLVQMHAVTVRYGRCKVLDRFDWQVNRGENWLVCGPNGSGKSTLLSLICGDHPQAYANDIRLFGRRRGSGESIWEIKARIGLMSPEFALRYRKVMSGRDVLLSGLFDSVGLFRTASAAQVAAVEGWAARLGVTHLLTAPFARLSNGERRLLLVARAMVKTPELLILDEPCQGLDTINRRRVLDVIQAIGESETTQLIYVTHRRDEQPGCITHWLRLGPSRGAASTIQRAHRAP
jgi:molybdate transport system ATP-binding protein